jgi:copper chaperone
MMTEIQMRSYIVPAMHCERCEQAVRDGVGQVAGVEEVAIDLGTKRVTVRGRDVSDEAVRAAIDDAGYEVA